jgi:hypothetical protein
VIPPVEKHFFPAFALTGDKLNLIKEFQKIGGWY